MKIKTKDGYCDSALGNIIPPAPAIALQVPFIVFLSCLTRHLFINLKFQSSAVKAAHYDSINFKHWLGEHSWMESLLQLREKCGYRLM